MTKKLLLFTFILSFTPNISANIYPNMKDAKYTDVIPLKMNISMKLNKKNDSIKYVDKSFFDKTNFNKINKDQLTFRAEEILGFLKIFKNLKDYPEQFNVDFIEQDNSFTMRCEIMLSPKKEPINIYRSRKKYNFNWFLNPLKLNLNQFKTISKNKLHWAGKIDNVRITIDIDFGFPINHNKKEVWKKE